MQTDDKKATDAFNGAGTNAVRKSLAEALKNLRAPLIPVGPILPGVFPVLPPGLLANAAGGVGKIFKAMAQRRETMAEIIHLLKSGFGSDTPAPDRAAFTRRDRMKQP